MQPKTTPFGRKVTQAERKKEREKRPLIVNNAPRAAHALCFDQHGLMKDLCFKTFSNLTWMPDVIYL